SIKTVTREVHVLSSDFQRNYGAFTPGRKKKFVSLAKETKNFAKKISIQEKELKKAGFFGFGSRSEYQMLGIGSWFKAVGDAFKSEVKEIKDKFIGIKVEEGIDVRNKNVNGKNWMSGLSDNTPMWKLSIPGSRKSMTYLSRKNLLLEVPTYQYKSLKEQLELGCRIFEINLDFDDRDGKREEGIIGEMWDDNEHIRRDRPYNGSMYKTVLPGVVDFIKKNPSEVIYLCGDYIRNSKFRDYYFNKNPNDKQYFIDFNGGEMFQKNIEELRGKIIFSNFLPEKSFKSGEYRSMDDIIKQQEKTISSANTLPDGKIKFSNYGVYMNGVSSPSQILSAWTLEEYCKHINPALRNYITKHKEIRKMGAMLFDLIGTKDSYEMDPAVIWQVNFR
ncbi:MAG: hypothetical protein LBS28_00035, partial [Streptococcaceae bacterium]|nr:hypothetical protein [Streptococcaceae bacterium]